MQIVLPFLVPLGLMGSFIVFDFFHITQTWMQVTVVVAPLLVIAGLLWHFKEAIRRQSAVSVTAYDAAKAEKKSMETYR